MSATIQGTPLAQRVTMISLPVADMARSHAFYAALGWKEAAGGSDDFVFFDMGGLVFGLIRRDLFAKEVVGDGPTVTPGPSMLAHNVADKAAVDAAIARAVAAGARLVRPPADQFWGGYSGLFADPDGHYWEVAWNPHWPLDAQGRPQLAP